MRYGQLRDHFKGVGAKLLTAVDAEPTSSNQHEIGTTMAMRREFLGEEGRKDIPAVYIGFGYAEDTIIANSTATYYDTREHQPHRGPEWRIYYPSNALTETMSVGDALFLALDAAGTLYFIVAPAESTSERQLSWLFGVQPEKSFNVRGFGADTAELNFAARMILDQLGIEFKFADAAMLDSIIEPLGTSFPGTKEFSRLARDSFRDVSPRDDPDGALLAWLDHEEALFRRLERLEVSDRLERGFVDSEGVDVDGFIKFSLGVHNRRKVRRGHSLENQIAAVFETHGISYVRNASTESGEKPDFLIPSLETYLAAPPEGTPGLAMLGAKSTCKDRWRQVLAEAPKIPRKHLLTLEPGISPAQTAQMDSHDLQLVVPKPIHITYTPDQRQWLWTFGDFLEAVS